MVMLESTKVVAVIGLGYVGLPLAAAFVRAGYCVLGFDSDGDKISRFALDYDEQSKRCPICYVKSLQNDFEGLLKARGAGRYEALSASAVVPSRRAAEFCICDQTPVKQQQTAPNLEPKLSGSTAVPDLSYIEKAIDRIASHGLGDYLACPCTLGQSRD